MSKTPFRIGLVGAGAVSAGAYSAGVMDFIIYALDQWYAAKESDMNVPRHEVELSVFSGSSAGGMTAALSAAYLASSQPSIRNEADGRNNHGKNRLFDAWVKRVDISRLLSTRDLRDSKHKPKKKVVSLLDSTVLRTIADKAMDVPLREHKRPYVADDFHILLTVTNLRGVPYTIEFGGDAQRQHRMSLHADYIHFKVTDQPDTNPSDHYTCTWEELCKPSPIQQKLKKAALASGAFPIGLAPHTLSHTFKYEKADCYSLRQWPIPQQKPTDTGQCNATESIPIDWTASEQDYEYHFHCVDGGVMNNEPVELARRILSGGSGKRNERDGDKADRAILMIDPFPSKSPPKQEYDQEQPELLGVLKDIFRALINQSRFKPDELILAKQEDVYSRFIIAPSRHGELYPIASGGLGGFGGFLKEDFREHDYFLGRYNAQRFLQKHFVLPENNPLFSAENWSDEIRNTYRVMKGDRPFLPIIPLVNAAKEPCTLLAWPRYTQRDLTKLHTQLEHRFDVLLDHLVEQYFKGHPRLVRWGAKFLLKLKKKEVMRQTERSILNDLKAMKLWPDNTET